MLSMSFYDGTLNKEKLIEFIKNTDKRIQYTHGLKFRGPTTYEVPIDKEQALEIIANNSMIDVKEQKDFIDLNTYSGNDMF